MNKMEESKLTDLDEFKHTSLFLKNQEKLKFEDLPKLQLQDNIDYHIATPLKQGILSDYEKIEGDDTKFKSKISQLIREILHSMKLVVYQQELGNTMPTLG